jgi:uncharacterized protein (DUF1015 family)
MAVVKPFRAVRYNPAKVGPLDKVIALPYDRIDEKLQETYYNLSPYNVVRMSLGKRFPDDNETNNVYTRARKYFDEWLKEGILTRDPKPCFYAYTEEFTVPGTGDRLARRGVIGMIKLVPFDEGTILPHERTLSGPKVDRLNLLRAMEVHLGQIFILYPDPENRINQLLDAHIQREPDIDAVAVGEADVRHKVWVIDDPKVLAAIQQEMAPKRNLIIADGHHRYETALAYRDEMRAKHPDWTEQHAFNYVMATLVSMSDPGLVILPTHRLIHSYTRMSAGEILEKARQYFDVQEMPSREALEAKMRELANQAHVIGFYDGKGYYLLTLRDLAAMDQVVKEPRAPEWKALDVSILHELILEHIMGLTKESIERKENIDYLRDPGPGYAAVSAGEANFLFLLNPTKPQQVAACAAKGEKMPQKSTDFYPKVLTGLTFAPIRWEDKLE